MTMFSLGDHVKLRFGVTNSVYLIRGFYNNIKNEELAVCENIETGERP